MPASSRTDINRPQAQMSPAGLLVDYGNEITWWRHVYDADGVPGVARRFAEGGTPTYDEKFPRKMHPELYTARTEGRITELGAIVRSVRDAAGQGTLAGADLAQASDRILELLHGNTARGQWHPAFEARSAVSLARELTPILLKMLSADRAMTVAYGSDKGDQVLELLERSAPFKGSLKEQSSCETGEVLGRFGLAAESLYQQLLSVQQDLTVPYARVRLLKITAADVLFSAAQMQHIVDRESGELPKRSSREIRDYLSHGLKVALIGFHDSADPLPLEMIASLRNASKQLAPKFILLVSNTDHVNALRQVASEHFLKRFLRFHGTISIVEAGADLSELDLAIARHSAYEVAEALVTARHCFK